jgi:hypothetical protein
MTIDERRVKGKEKIDLKVKIRNFVGWGFLAFGLWSFEVARMRKSIYANDDLVSNFNTLNSKDTIQDKFNEETYNELLNFINTKLELYNKLSEDKVNLIFKRLWFNDIYDQRVRGIV